MGSRHANDRETTIGMNIDLKNLKQYRKANSFERAYLKWLFPLIIFGIGLEVLIAIAFGIGIGFHNPNGLLLGLLLVFAFFCPLLPIFILFSIQNYASKKFVILKKELFDSKMLAEDILKLGEEHGIDLLDEAIVARCIHELGWEYVPEGYAKDRIMPDKKE